MHIIHYRASIKQGTEIKQFPESAVFFLCKEIHVFSVKKSQSAISTSFRNENYFGKFYMFPEIGIMTRCMHIQMTQASDQ